MSEVDEITDDSDCGLTGYAGPWCVAVFLVDRAYGGPEEGGWWFDTGTVADPDTAGDIPCPRWFINEDEARDFKDELQARLDNGINVGRREIGSLLSEGRYEAITCDGWPQNFPARRPHYE